MDKDGKPLAQLGEPCAGFCVDARAPLMDRPGRLCVNAG